MKQKARQELLERINETLNQWDPIGVVRKPGRQEQEYKSYASGILRLLLQGCDKQRLAHHLARLAHQEMGLSEVDDRACERSAKALLELIKNQGA